MKGVKRRRLIGFSALSSVCLEVGEGDALVCFNCRRLTEDDDEPSVTLPTVEEMQVHLQAHQNAGDTVLKADRALERWADAKTRAGFVKTGKVVS